MPIAGPAQAPGKSVDSTLGAQAASSNVKTIKYLMA